MRIHYFGHACFLLEDNNFSVIIDPFCDIGYNLVAPKVDYCICSHEHFDHNARFAVDATNFPNENDYSTISWLKVVNSFHDDAFGKLRGENSIFVVECGGFSVCHLGDLGEPFNEEICKKIGKIDILLIPIGGKYTIDSKEALKFIKCLNPKIVIPMHYKTASSQIDIAKKDDFLANFTSIIKTTNDITIEKLPCDLTVYDIDDKEF